MAEYNVENPKVETTPWRNISIVWLVPILAAIIGGLVAWQSLSERGPLVEIRFSKSEGIKAGKTEIKHKGVVVGLVEDVTFSNDLKEVVVRARMEKVVAPYLGDTTDFWIVSANVRGANFTGLGTILSGVYIEVDWSGPAQERRRAFDGLAAQPLTPPSAQGRHVKLRSEEAGSVNVGTPVFYRRLRVGQIESRRLAEDYGHIEYEAFIEAPYDSILNATTQFWNVSGVSVVAGTGGLEVRMESLDAFLAGGVAFGDIGLNAGTAELPEDKVFNIYSDRDSAVESQFETPEGGGYLFMATFEDSTQGLEPGAPIEWQGIRIGTVADIVLDLGDGPEDGGFVWVYLELQPARVGLLDASIEDIQLAMDSWVREGMRPQLATGNILSGKKLVRFVEGVGDDGALIDFDTLPYPTFPTAPSDLEAVAQNVEQVVANLAELPLDELVGAAIDLLSSTDALLADPETKRLPGELNETLASLSSAAANIDEASQSLPELVSKLNQFADIGESVLGGLAPESELYVDLSSAVLNLRDAARSLSALAVRLEEQPNSLIVGR